MRSCYGGTDRRRGGRDGAGGRVVEWTEVSCEESCGGGLWNELGRAEVAKRCAKKCRLEGLDGR